MSKPRLCLLLLSIILGGHTSDSKSGWDPLGRVPIHAPGSVIAREQYFEKRGISRDNY